MPKKKDKLEKLEELPGIGPTTADKLREAGYDDLMSIAVAHVGELADCSGLTEAAANRAILAARKCLDMGFVTGKDVLKKREDVGKITTGSKEVDKLIGGGVETQGLFECFGEFGCITADTKITLADGATGNSSQIGNIGKIMMLNYTESLHLLEMYDATHIVVFTTFNPGDPQQQWPFGDNVKWQWMVQIPGMNVSEYYDREGVTEKYLDSTLNRLMTLNPSPGFELVFASDYRFVMVYEINYDAIK